MPHGCLAGSVLAGSCTLVRFRSSVGSSSPPTTPPVVSPVFLLACFCCSLLCAHSLFSLILHILNMSDEPFFISIDALEEVGISV